MIEDDESELAQCEDDRTCPRCRGGLQVQLLQSKSNEELGVSWAKYQYQCDTCSYTSPTWETLD